jgi:CheY-like chemotaxis protein
VVRDTGPGIAQERIANLFEEFHSFGKTEGTGLGLAFCRRVMHVFGGDIACHSVYGKFTEFTLTFPPLRGSEQAVLAERAALTAAGSRFPELSPAAFDGQLVLVVDDSAFNRTIVKARLRELGLRTTEASHGAEALRMIDEGTAPAAIVMDMQMPGMTGIDVTRELRSRSSPANAIPVLALSANDLPAWRDDALRAGMNGYLAKPLDPELLRSELARILGSGPSRGRAAGDRDPPTRLAAS